ncbi:unnamed protein product [Caenorhabditis sp. 36 PRJEB53466]|nr:unnamed protein product [Caenorhabditis sp. 36 PRJEB53466]
MSLNPEYDDNYKDFLLSPQFELASTDDDDEDFNYATNVMEYANEYCEEEEEIDVEGVEMDQSPKSGPHQQNLAELLAIQPISTADRLAAYSEMQLVKPLRSLKNSRAKKQKNEKETADKECSSSSSTARTVVPKILAGTPSDKSSEESPQLRHWKNADRSDALFCATCQQCFRSQVVYTLHQKRHDKGLEIPIPNFLCPMPGCNVRCDCQATVNKHVQDRHNRGDLVIEHFSFTSWTEFERWKDNLEDSTSSRFVHSSGKPCTLGKTRRLSCFFSRRNDSYKRPARGIRSKLSRKQESTCTAHMSVKDIFGEISVRACLTHCGHESAHLQKLPLSTVIKREIAELLVQGLNEEEIVRNLKQASNQNDRRFYIQPYEVRNILNKIIKNQLFRREKRQEETVATEETKPERIKEEVPPAVANEEVV